MDPITENNKETFAIEVLKKLGWQYVHGLSTAPGAENAERDSFEHNQNKRPDILLFVNGIPLVLIELKNPADENAAIGKAYDQIQTYKATIPGLFTYNAICIISDGMECRAGSVSAGFTRYMTWKSADGKKEASK